MIQSWKELTKLTGGSPFLVERIRLTATSVAIEGQFDPPPLAQLTEEDQIFVSAFVRCHGSIKQMEKFFGVSYPTIKNRLNRIGELLPFAEIKSEDEPPPAQEPRPSDSPSDPLARLERGEATVQQVLAELKKNKGETK